MKFTPATATLIIGNTLATQKQALILLQKIFCTQGGCTTCNDCRLLQADQHPGVQRIRPEKKYTLDLLEPLFQTIGFTLQENTYFFFVLEKADLLTTACANSLLKLIEEPPAGYHFLLLAQQTELMLPTIRSRCQTIYAHSAFEMPHPSFLRHFMEVPTLPHTFLKDLQSHGPEEHDVPLCMDALVRYWIEASKKAVTEQDQQKFTKTQAMVTCLQTAQKTSAMPGSAKIFWRNLFLLKEECLSL